jgi:hypothetical protein
LWNFPAYYSRTGLDSIFATAIFTFSRLNCLIHYLWDEEVENIDVENDVRVVSYAW